MPFRYATASRHRPAMQIERGVVAPAVQGAVRSDQQDAPIVLRPPRARSAAPAAPPAPSSPPPGITLRPSMDQSAAARAATGGEVQLGANLYDAQHHLLQEDYARLRLPRSLRPRQQLRLACVLPALHRATI